MEKLVYSAAYYPELWSWDVIREDVARMKQVGLNAVRIGEFAWSRMEPNEGEIDLSFFREVITYLYENGISTILCTPTPTPPIWLSHNHPERLFVNTDGVRMHHGGRQHVCTNHPAMRAASDRIVTAMARELGRLPGVIAWQLDNEFKAHVHECTCDVCAGLWHDWLRKKYGSVERLNDAWGAQIWSEQYQTFDQVPPLLRTPMLYNSSLALNYRLFSHEKIAEFAARQAEILRQYSDAPITHNTCPQFGLNNETLFAKLDFVSYDMYPNCDQYPQATFQYDLFRSLGQDGRFWLMETSTSYNGCLIGAQKPHRPGFLEAELFAAAAAGAEGISFWLWRQQRSGCEQLHGSLLSSWGQPTIGYEPAVRAGKRLRAMEPLLCKTRVAQAEVGLSYSDVARAFYEVEPVQRIEYISTMQALHGVLAGMGVPRDFVWPDGSLDGYKVVVTPYLPHIPDELIARGRAFVEQGGVWIVGPMSGYRTAELTVPTDCGLEALEKAFGFTTLYHYPVHDSGASVSAFGCTAEATQLAAVFSGDSGTVVGRYAGGATDGEAAVIELTVGQGKLVVVGAPVCGDAGEAFLRALWGHYFTEAGVRTPYTVDGGTAASLRCDAEGGRYLLLSNLDGRGGMATLHGDWRRDETGSPVHTVSLPPYGTEILYQA